MTSDQTTTTTTANPQHNSHYDWSNIATIRRSISRNRSNASDRYPKNGDYIRYSSYNGHRESPTLIKTPSRAGSTELGINSNGPLYPHLEEQQRRPIFGHNLRTAKSEYYLSPPKKQSHYQRPGYVTGWNHHQRNNIDDDTKWITSSSSTASYHSAGSSNYSARALEEDQEALEDERLYAEIGKPVSMASLPPLDRGAPYRGYSPTRRLAATNTNTCCGSIYQQTNNGVGDNASSNCDDHTPPTPPPPALIMAGASHMASINGNQAQPPQMRKYFTLNNPRNQQQRQCHPNVHPRRMNLEEDLRRRSMTNTTLATQKEFTGDASQHQQQLNRSQSCYVDPLDYKVGCQNTLRSKPLIPWYELAIKDSNRRSCPQLEVDMIEGIVGIRNLLTFLWATLGYLNNEGQMGK